MFEKISKFSFLAENKEQFSSCNETLLNIECSIVKSAIGPMFHIQGRVFETANSSQRLSGEYLKLYFQFKGFDRPTLLQKSTAYPKRR